MIVFFYSECGDATNTMCDQERIAPWHKKHAYSM